MVDLHLVHPALNLSTLDAGILIMVQQVVLTEHGGLLYVLPLAVHLNFFLEDNVLLLYRIPWTILSKFHALKLFVGGGGPRPFGFGFETKGLGPGLDNKGFGLVKDHDSAPETYLSSLRVSQFPEVR